MLVPLLLAVLIMALAWAFLPTIIAVVVTVLVILAALGYLR